MRIYLKYFFVLPCFLSFVTLHAQTISFISTDDMNIAVDAAGNTYHGLYSVLKKRTAAGVMTTIAGTGTAGYSGDGGPATAAQLCARGQVAVDGAGNVYFIDTTYRIRKVSTTGIITTIAGTGMAGYSGDDSVATNARICPSQAIASDMAGNVYFFSSSMYNIRKISASGIITTFAGNYSPGYGGDNGPATNATLDFDTRRLATDNMGNVYTCEHNNHVIRKINTSGIIKTIAGTSVPGYSGDTGMATAARLNFPLCVAADNAGNVYITDNGNYRIRKINSAGIISTIAGTGIAGCGGDGGPAIAAAISSPNSIGTDGAGNIYFADANCTALRKISAPPAVVPVEGLDNVSILPTINDGTFEIRGSIDRISNEPVLIEIASIAGQVIYRTNCKPIGGGINEKITLGDIAEGMYFLRLQSVSGNVTYKFVVER